MAFQDISGLVIKASGNIGLNEKFINANDVSFMQYTPSKAGKLGEALLLSLRLKNKDAVLELLEVPSIYEVVTSD